MVKRGGIERWWSFPIYSSIPNLSNVSITRQDDAYLILPKFKLIIYSTIAQTSAGTLVTEFDNTTGTKILFVNCEGINRTESLKLYYNNVEITNIYEIKSIGDYSTTGVGG